MITYNSIPELLDSIPPTPERREMEQLSFKFMDQLNKEHSIFLTKKKLLSELKFFKENGSKPDLDNHIVKYYDKKCIEIETLLSEL